MSFRKDKVLFCTTFPAKSQQLIFGNFNSFLTKSHGLSIHSHRFQSASLNSVTCIHVHLVSKVWLSRRSAGIDWQLEGGGKRKRKGLFRNARLLEIQAIITILEILQKQKKTRRVRPLRAVVGNGNKGRKGLFVENQLVCYREEKPPKPQNRPKIPPRHPNSPTAGDRKNTPKYQKNTPKIRISYFWGVSGAFEKVFRGVSFLHGGGPGYFWVSGISYSVADQWVLKLLAHRISVISTGEK